MPINHINFLLIPKDTFPEAPPEQPEIANEPVRREASGILFDQWNTGLKTKNN